MWSTTLVWIHGPVSIVFRLQRIEWKRPKTVQKLFETLFEQTLFEIMKKATQKRSTYLYRAEKILPNDFNGIRISRFNDELPVLKQWKKSNVCLNRQSLIKKKKS